MSDLTSLTIGEAAEHLGEFAKTIRDLLTRGLFPAPDGEREGVTSWNVETLERWREERDSTPPAEPFFMSDSPIAKDRVGATLRRLAMLGIRGRVWLDSETGRYSLVFPISREQVGRMASRFAREAPRFRVVLIDSEARPARGWLDIPADGIDVRAEVTRA